MQNLEYKPHMVINFHIDVCMWINGTLSNKFVDILRSDLNKYGNSIMACPQYVS